MLKEMLFHKKLRIDLFAMNKVFIICVALVFNFTSCGTQYLVNSEEEVSTNNSDSEPSDVINLPLDIVHEWKVETVRTDAKESFMKIISNNKTPTLNIYNNSSVNGYDGCNGYSSKIMVDNSNNIKFLSFLATSRGCHPSVYWHEKFYKALGSINNYVVQNGKLLLKKDSHILMTFSKIK